MLTRTRSVLAAAGAAALVILAWGPAALSHSTAESVMAATAGCGKTPTLRSGTYSLQHNGKSRSYILRVPDNYDNTRQYRLVFGFHWLNGTATDVATGQTVQRDVWSYYGLQRLANNTAIFVAPQGLNNGWANSAGEDVTLVDAIINQIESDLCVDTAQRFAVGFSYGGAMSNALACARPDVFRAVAVQSGAQLSGCGGGTQPVAYLGIHGLRDSVLAISQGRTLRDRFVRNNGCTAQNPPEPSQGSLSHRVTTYSGCRSGYPVTWAAFDEGHIAAPQDGATGDSGSRTWVPAEVWRFFTQFTSPTPSPSPSPSPSASPSPSPSPGTGSCRVTYTTNAWNTGLTTAIKITNTGSTAVNGWALRFTLSPGQVITNGWNAIYEPTSGAVTATNVSYNADLAAGASLDIGFQATHTGNTTAPATFTLNGSPCTTA
ncbi:cellulose binding domain-containing protein [Herbidospora galbida]|uniref:cellulose binding domain-containing protein n=1 Tax=Herbidospora galbida TaxID=2575442 RepID=UPI001FEBF219|nr:cellulose binding domain-containing protein [Herbidospora galbida]